MQSHQGAKASSKTGANDDNVIFGMNQTESECMDMQHKVLADANLQLVYEPIDLSKGGLRIMDQATGSDELESGSARRRSARLRGTQNMWVGTDIEDSYFPQGPPADKSYHYQSMMEPWIKDWEASFDLVHSRMALLGVGTNPLENVINNLIALVKSGSSWKIGPTGALFRTAIKDLFIIVSGGQRVDLREKLILLFSKAGFENFDYKIITSPSGPRTSDAIRATNEASLFATAMGVSMTTKMLPPISVSREQLDDLSQKLIDETKKDGWVFKCFVLSRHLTQNK
ncbi:hypothetical protein BS50DRAFT_602690 [Corynespora cassiicola Philippines]|uniref:Uncharacterized protein n=1 Tax=Corynespora cassiicola Philippines TaxID=1448308 RepID=A0A2T2NFU0_CORCC|nr:hypothetical protein BS50DRAFT_602690 [Corynespora cassiicola Philippines]